MEITDCEPVAITDSEVMALMRHYGRRLDELGPYDSDIAISNHYQIAARLSELTAELNRRRMAILCCSTLADQKAATATGSGPN